MSSVVPPSFSVTVPVGVPAPGEAALTVAVKVTSWPKTDSVTPDGRLTFEDAKAGGYTLGSGVVMAFDDTVDLVGIVLRIAAFFRDESCGQCVPCRVGTARQEEAIRRLADGRPRGSVSEEVALIDEIAQVMRDASICGLGQTAASAIQSAMSRFGLFTGGTTQ